MTVYSSLHNLPLEGRPYLATEAHQHLSHMRSFEELLPMLHARSVFRFADRCP
jgi:hypothetical protein